MTINDELKIHDDAFKNYLGKSQSMMMSLPSLKVTVVFIGPRPNWSTLVV